MGKRARAVAAVLLPLIAFAADANGEAAPTYSRCTEFCDDLSEREVQVLDLTPIEQFANAGASVVRVTTEGNGSDRTAIDVAHVGAAHAVLVVRSLRKVGVIPRLSERTVILSEARWNDIAARARAAIVRREQFLPKPGPGNSCTEHSSAVAIAGDRKLLLARACFREDGIPDFAHWLSNEAAHALPGCERLDDPGERSDESMLDTCLKLEGNRALAAEIANLLSKMDFADAGYAVAAREPHRRFAFTNDCWVRWPNTKGDVNGEAACQKALDEQHGHPGLAFDGFYGLAPRENKPDEVWATGTAIYEADMMLPADNGEVVQVLGAWHAPFSMSWQRGADGEWRIAHWNIGEAGATGPDE